MTVRIGVLGCGRIGAMHAELIARRVPGASLAAVFDVVPAAAQRVAGDLGCRAAVDPAGIFDADDVDAVAICTSTDTHVELLVAGAAAGKPIFCEKPVSLDLAETDRALGAVADAGVPVFLGFNRRFDPSHRSVAERVRSGELGEVHLTRITSRDPAPPPISYIAVSGGIFCDMTVHDFDMARFVTGSEIVEVYAIGAVRVDPAIGEAGDLDTVAITVTHANGAITTIDNSRQAVYGYDQRVEAFGSQGLAVSDNPYVTTALTRTAEGTRHSTIPYFFLDRYIPSYVAEWTAFVAMVTEGSPPPVTAADGRAALVAGLAAWRSFREHRPVRIDEFPSAG